MKVITIADVRHLAQLSNVQVSDEEIENLQSDLSNILEYIDQLKDVDTSNIEPTYQVTGLENITRDDKIDDGGVTPEQLLALAPEQADHSVKVPQVL